jgi:ABC-type sulfate transport system substrate-binding protein
MRARASREYILQRAQKEQGVMAKKYLRPVRTQIAKAHDSRPQIIVGYLFARVAPDVLVFAPLVARGP